MAMPEFVLSSLAGFSPLHAASCHAWLHAATATALQYNTGTALRPSYDQLWHHSRVGTLCTDTCTHTYSLGSIAI